MLKWPQATAEVSCLPLAEKQADYPDAHCHHMAAPHPERMQSLDQAWTPRLSWAATNPLTEKERLIPTQDEHRDIRGRGRARQQENLLPGNPGEQTPWTVHAKNTP